MQIYPTKVPRFIQKAFPGAIWKSQVSEKSEIFLTFDDGPNNYTTPLICDILGDNNVKATFFLTGENIPKAQQALERMVADGHLIGNHGFRHVAGWKLDKRTFLDNVIRGYEITGSKLFRPPFGQITPGQYTLIKDQCSLIMWTIMPGDFHQNTSADMCLKRIVNNIQPGDIIVLHDQQLLEKKIEKYLPRLIEVLSNKGFEFGLVENVVGHKRTEHSSYATIRE